ncbi:XrtA-associated ATPase [Geminicoccaceae bacterium 1502E]|nr:XrtA-associated ATPase [Geminicoccaceae bacterium 1502E]
MYTEFYGLAGRPFQLSPNHRFYYGSRGHRRAVAYLTYGLHQAEGFIVITGDVGAGKTTLIGYLQERLADQSFVAARLNATRVDADDVLRLVAGAFGLPMEGRSKATLVTAIEARLREIGTSRQRVLLIVDEVQNLPPDSLEELRMLSNLEEEGRALLQILLVGQPQFRDTIAGPALEQLRQRVVASYHLGPLDESEVQAYVEHRLRKVAWREDPAFDADTHAAIFAATGGLPRRINMLCARLLVYGAIEQRHLLTAEDVRMVAAEVEQEQTPAPPREQGALPPPRPAPDMPVPDMPVQTGAPAPDEWRDEAMRLQRKLEQLHEDLGRERHRHDSVRAEAERLRETLQRIEVERVRLDAETMRRLVELAGRLDARQRRGLLDRLKGRDDDAA